MSVLDNPIVNSFLVFLVSSLLFYAMKPKFMFNKDGKMKKFGYGKNKTCFTFPVTVFGITLVSFIFFKVFCSGANERISSGRQRSSRGSTRANWGSRGSSRSR